jgi:hypothetical protein
MSWPWIIAFGALWVLVLVLAMLVLGMLRRIAPLLAEAENIVRQQHDLPDDDGIPLGSEVPKFELIDAEGDIVRPGESLALPAVFLFVQSGCEPCQELTADISEHANSFAGTRMYVITAGDPNEYDMLRARGFSVFGQPDGQASAAFKQREFPNAFAVDRDSRVISKMTRDSVDDLERLIQDAHAHDEVHPITNKEDAADRRNGSKGRNQTRMRTDRGGDKA